MGVASSSRTFFQQIGGSIGVAAFGAVFAHQLTQGLAAPLPGVRLTAGGGQLSPVVVNKLPPAVRHDVFAAISHAVTSVFWYVVPAAALVFLLGWLIREVPLRSGRAPAEEATAPELVG
jgi:uncharacterized membrane protein YeiH